MFSYSNLQNKKCVLWCSKWDNIVDFCWWEEGNTKRLGATYTLPVPWVHRNVVVKSSVFPFISIIYICVCVEKYPMTTRSTFQFKLPLVCLVWVGASKFAKFVLAGRLLGMWEITIFDFKKGTYVQGSMYTICLQQYGHKDTHKCRM